jgi:hypothetical protein
MMATIKLTKTTTIAPDRFLAALNDFGPDRSQIWGLTDPKYQKVHSKSDFSADVTEGSGGIWERLAYDWSEPGVVRMTTVDSNTWGGKSGHTYTLSKAPDGRTKIDVVVVREGKNFKGKAIGAVLSVVGKVLVGRELTKTLHAIEALAGPTARR